MEVENFNKNVQLETAKSAENRSASDRDTKSSENMVVNCQEIAKSVDGEKQSTAAVAEARVSDAAERAAAPEASIFAKLSDVVAAAPKSKQSSESEDKLRSSPTNVSQDKAASLPPLSGAEDEISTPNKSCGDDDGRQAELPIPVVSDVDEDDEITEDVNEEEVAEDEDESGNEISEGAEGQSQLQDDDSQETTEAILEEEAEDEEIDDEEEEEVLEDEDDDGDDDEEEEEAEVIDEEEVEDDEEGDEEQNLEFDSSSNDEPDKPQKKIVQEDDDDVALVLDSSEEEEIEADTKRREHRRAERSESSEKEEIYESEENDSEMSIDSDDEYDDLMDDIAVSKNFKVEKEKPKKGIHEQKFMHSKVTKRYQRTCDWRLKLKKRSFKWLLKKRMHNVDESHPAVVAIDYINRSSNLTSIPKLQDQDVFPLVITQIESIAEKVPTTSKSPSHSTESTITAEIKSIEMQQIDKRLECIKKSLPEDVAIKESNIQSATPQQQQQSNLPQLNLKEDEHNKENVGNNDKGDNAPGLQQKLNGASDASKRQQDQQQQGSSSVAQVEQIEIVDDSDDVMDTSDETSTATTVIEIEPTIKESSSCDTKSQVLKQVNIKKDRAEIADLTEQLEKKGDPIKNDTNINPNDKIDAIIAADKTVPFVPPSEQNETKTMKSDLPKILSPLAPESIKKEKSPSPLPLLPAVTISTPKVSPPPLPPPPSIVEPSAKRSRSASLEDRVQDDEDDVHPNKKLKAQLESNFPTHDQILNEYIDKTSNNSVDEIQKHLGQLIVEIQTLNDMIKAKEIEWNNMLHLKKVKEEICFRLTRKKQIMEIMSTKVGEIDNCASGGADGGGGDVSLLASCVESLNNLAEFNKFCPAAVSAATTIAITPSIPIKFATATSSTPNNSKASPSVNANLQNASILNNLSNISTISNNPQQQNKQQMNAGAPTSTFSVQNILQNRANMRSSDLVKEKATTQRLHRILVSRNILPKPSSLPTSTTSASSGNSPGLSISKLPTVSTPNTLSLSTAIPTVPSVSFSGSITPINLAGCSRSQTANEQQQQPILNNYLTATATIQQQLGEMLNGHHSFHHSGNQQQQNVANGNQALGVGRQGPFKDVKSIIADYRQKHPEQVPRRGRRMKSSALANMTQAEASTFLGNVLKSDSKLAGSDLGALLAKFDGNSRPSSNDSSHSMTNPIGTNSNTGNGGDSGNLGNISFKDVLIQFAKMSGQNNTDRLTAVNTAKSSAKQSSSTAPPPYPEVTLHPVSTSHTFGEQTSGSLLHGILTKYNRPNTTSTATSAATSTTQTTSPPNYNSSFSPTLARLLTAPERITTATHNTNASILPSYHQSGGLGQHHHQLSTGTNSAGLNISKMVAGHNSEITITPVVSSQQQVPTLLQQQLEHQQQQMILKRDRMKVDSFMHINDDEADDSIDRLVIDEDGDSPVGVDDNVRIAPNAYGQEFHENEVPVCQGCKKQEAQFVCAGCGNQWYCSRECQVTSWDEHSEICTG